MKKEQIDKNSKLEPKGPIGSAKNGEDTTYPKVKIQEIFINLISEYFRLSDSDRSANFKNRKILTLLRRAAN